MMKQAGLSTVPPGDLFASLEAQAPDDGRMPARMRPHLSYRSSRLATEARIERFRKGQEHAH